MLVTARIDIIGQSRRIMNVGHNAQGHYAILKPAPVLAIDFGAVEAFKVYEESSSPWPSAKLPMINNPTIKVWAWPLLEIVESAWIKRVVDRNAALEGYPWRHIVVVTIDRTLHVMTNGPSQVDLISPGPAS